MSNEQEIKKIVNRLYYQANREKLLEWQNEYYRKNREKRLKYQNEYNRAKQ
jgi:hypothetical protein